MNAMPQPDRFDLRHAPMRIGRVVLRVRDLERVGTFYRHALGLVPLAQDAGSVTLGAGTAALLQLIDDPAARPRDPREAGLFHTAFLLPSRRDLGAWLAFAIRNGIPLQGASDHIVSEAIYLADPEGNGIEVYADQPLSRWRKPDGEIHMATEALDARSLIDAGQGHAWAGFPADGVVGHVHLQVGDTLEADRFYSDVLGFDIASRYPGASFYGSGGYHHQIAANIWNSRRAGRRPDGAAGLAGVELVIADQAQREAILARAAKAGLAVSKQDGSLVLHDPWATAITLMPEA